MVARVIGEEKELDASGRSVKRLPCMGGPGETRRLWCDRLWPGMLRLQGEGQSALFYIEHTVEYVRSNSWDRKKWRRKMLDQCKRIASWADIC